MKVFLCHFDAAQQIFAGLRQRVAIRIGQGVEGPGRDCQTRSRGRLRISRLKKTRASATCFLRPLAHVFEIRQRPQQLLAQFFLFDFQLQDRLFRR